MAKGKVEAVDGVSTLIIGQDESDTDTYSPPYSCVSILNLGSSTVYLNWGEDAANEEGFALAPNGTDGDQIVLPLYMQFPRKLFAWADGTDCELVWGTTGHN